MTDAEIIQAYKKAYADPMLEGIKSDLRTPSGGLVLATGVRPAVAFDALLDWAGLDQ